MDSPTRFRSWAEVPAGLAPANDLRFAGLEPTGAPVALLVLGEREVELFRSSDAAPRAAPTRAPPSTSREAAPIGTPGSTPRSSRRSVAALPAAPALRARRARSDGDPAASRRAAMDWVQELLEAPFVVLDTETTGLGYEAEIVEIGVVASDGTTLLERLVRPRSGRIPAAAARVHGLTMSELAEAPTWAEIHDQVLEVTAGTRILAWNATFDERMVRQSARAWSLPARLRGFECAMEAYASCRGLRRARAKLERAAASLGLLEGTRQRHRSCDDARLTLAVLRGIAGRRD